LALGDRLARARAIDIFASRVDCLKASLGLLPIVLEGAPAVWRRELEGGRIIDCLFCGDCGVRLFHNPERNPRASIVKPGTLDDTSWLKPVGHIWTKSAQSWVRIPNDTVNYEAQPPDLSRLIEAWQAQQAK
jgi:hypothetical protein